MLLLYEVRSTAFKLYLSVQKKSVLMSFLHVFKSFIYNSNIKMQLCYKIKCVPF